MYTCACANTFTSLWKTIIGMAGPSGYKNYIYMILILRSLIHNRN